MGWRPAVCAPRSAGAPPGPGTPRPSQAGGYFIGHGTRTAAALREHYAGHDRVVVLTDEQAAAEGCVDRAVPASVPMITFNLAGYRYGHAPSGSPARVTVGGLTDQAFRLIPAVQDGLRGRWPWE